MTYQACVGPSTTRLHIRDMSSDSPLVLCRATAPFRDYRARVPAVKICSQCLKKMAEQMNSPDGFAITAGLIGVQEIT